MTIGFDIDNTITRHPDIMREMMLVLMERGNRVLVVTGMIDSVPHRRGYRVEQLEGYGIVEGVHYDCLHIANGEDIWHVGASKGRILREEGADLFIDDSDEFLIQIRNMNPSMLLLKVVP